MTWFCFEFFVFLNLTKIFGLFFKKRKTCFFFFFPRVLKQIPEEQDYMAVSQEHR